VRAHRGLEAPAHLDARLARRGEQDPVADAQHLDLGLLLVHAERLGRTAWILRPWTGSAASAGSRRPSVCTGSLKIDAPSSEPPRNGRPKIGVALTRLPASTSWPQ
jgi:hypothetical protein